MNLTDEYKRILFLGDVHMPFHDWEVIEQARVFALKHKADLIYSVGDLTDQKSWSRFLKDPQDDCPETEWNKTVKASKELAKMFPKMLIRRSNHDQRYIKKAYEAGIVKAMLRGLDELFPYKGWRWILDNDPHILNGTTAVMHGDELQGSVKAKVQQLGYNVVQGHTHKAEIIYNCTFNRRLWGMDVGCMIDKKSAAFEYAAKYLSKVWVGYGWVQDGVPYLFPKKG